MPLFSVPKRSTRNDDRAVVRKSQKSNKQATTVRGNSVLSQIQQIKSVVGKTLGKYSDDYRIIYSRSELAVYIDACINTGVISIDTETTGLDPLQDKIVGLCLFTPGEKAVYVPINHVSYVTNTRIDGQLTEREVGEELQRVKDISIIMFNANFDIRVIRNQLGVYLTCFWDCYLAGRLLNENEESKGLKALHQKYVLDGKEDEFKFDALFKGIKADKIPIDTFYLYAAHDAIITYELYKYQEQFLYFDATTSLDARNGLNGVSWVFFNIEMPCINVICDMEDTGVKFDFEYQHKLSEKYNKLLDQKKNEFYAVCSQWRDKIDDYKSKHINHKLDDPINISSPTQIATLLYDIMQIEPPDIKNPRGTGVGILQKIDSPIAEAILEYREVSKLVTTYIDKLPLCVNPNDGRIHCNFNQYGADTGRLSSSDPNLQNIPSHNKDIRKMFIATNEEKLVSTDTHQFEVDRWCEVECADEWKYADNIVSGDVLLLDDKSCVNVVGTVITQDTVYIDFS